MITARDLLSKRVATVYADERMVDAAERIHQLQALHCAVMERDSGDPGELVGVVRLTDLVTRAGSASRIFADLVSEPFPPIVHSDEPAENIAARFAQTSPRELVVVSRGSERYLGIISVESLSHWLIQAHESSKRAVDQALAEQKRLTAFLEQKVENRTVELRAALNDFHRASLALSHDVRGPLRSIRSFAETIAKGEGGELNEEGKKSVYRIQKSVSLLEAMAEEILAKAREAFDGGPELTRIDLNEIFADAKIFLDSVIRARGAQVVRRGTLHPVSGSYVPVFQVIGNLLTNAIKYVPEGRTPKVEVWTEECAGRINLCVKDNGRGIAARDMSVIFEPFVTVNRAQPTETGLGLAITRDAISKLGGGICVTSEEGSGSIFVVTLAKPTLSSA